ncbi:MAG: hypothetical protein ACXWPP_14660 [Ktedonobacteraceae bacterium]
MGDADHIAATLGTQSREVHGTLSHDATAIGRSGGIHRDSGSIGHAMASDGRAQIAINPAGDTSRGRDAERERFGASRATVWLGQVGEVYLAWVAGGVAQGEEFTETCSHATLGKVPHLAHWPCDWRQSRRW